MRLPLRLFLFAVLISILLFNLPFSLKAETKCDQVAEDQKADCLSDLIKEYESKIGELQGKQKTLATTIQVLDNQIILTLTQISATEANIVQLNNEIRELSFKIGQLNDVLTDVSQVLSARIEETYKRLLISPVHFLFSADGFADFLSRLEYLRSAQYHDRELLYNMEEARLNFDQQKTLKEQKQQELEVLQKRLNSQKLLLGQQKASKQELLLITKNDEQTFQGLLATAQAEFRAIQAILAGKGDETEVGVVNEGENIARVMTSGPNLYACSTGPHLHFEVSKNGGHLNPFQLLSSKSLDWDNSDPPQNGSGSWSWPLNDPISITQGYGETAYSSRYTNNIHTGVDMVNKSNYSVKTVKKGKLFRGSISCSDGLLQYVRVKHENEDYNTYYLHVDYIK